MFDVIGGSAWLGNRLPDVAHHFEVSDQRFLKVAPGLFLGISHSRASRHIRRKSGVARLRRLDRVRSGGRLRATRASLALEFLAHRNLYRSQRSRWILRGGLLRRMESDVWIGQIQIGLLGELGESPEVFEAMMSGSDESLSLSTKLLPCLV